MNSMTNDKMTKETLSLLLDEQIRHYKTMNDILSEVGIKPARSPLPEYISENIIKYAIHLIEDDSCVWDKSMPGDLNSFKQGKIECKCFTSSGPLSFSPNPQWDVLYVLDGVEWVNSTFKLYRINLTGKSDEWSQIKVNKKDTMKMQASQGRRPRINWKALHSQINKYTYLIWSGHISDLIR